MEVPWRVFCKVGEWTAGLTSLRGERDKDSDVLPLFILTCIGPTAGGTVSAGMFVDEDETVYFPEDWVLARSNSWDPVIEGGKALLGMTALRKPLGYRWASVSLKMELFWLRLNSIVRSRLSDYVEDAQLRRCRNAPRAASALTHVVLKAVRCCDEPNTRLCLIPKRAPSLTHGACGAVFYKRNQGGIRTTISRSPQIRTAEVWEDQKS
jgi:hypothetical protein